MNVDFHIHSTHSDGVLDVPELIALAHERGVQEFSITDHDTLGAYRTQYDLCGMSLVVGCEFSASWRGRGVHLVGLNLDPQHPLMSHAMEAQSVARQERAGRIALALEKRGIPGALAGAQACADGAVLTRPHFAEHIVAQGYARDHKQAFKRYLGAGKPGDVRTYWPGIDEVVSWIEGSGGVAILAHPLKYGLTGTKLRELVQAFKDTGGTAIEVISGAQTADKTAQVAALARHFGLLASAGSDFHRPGQSWGQLGMVPPLPADLDPVWALWRSAQTTC